MIDFIFAERVIIYGAQPRVLVTHLPTHVPMALVLPLWWTRLLFLLVVFYRTILGRTLSLHSQMACSCDWHLHLIPALSARALLVIAHISYHLSDEHLLLPPVFHHELTSTRLDLGSTFD